ncbi:MAG: hypothetical protein U5L75_01415 [Candidatus Campbellbacteria bacterium]|nr:hypothetical protein [Candidatus Campbellbacteria bacterium]
MKYFLPVLLVTLVVVGTLAFFAGSHNDDKPPTPSAEKEVAESNKEEAGDDDGKKNYCFNSEESIADNGSDVSDESRLVSLGNSYNVQIPSSAEFETVNSDHSSYHRVILKRDKKDRPYNAFTVRVHRLSRDIYNSGGLGGGVVYEGLSDRWYKIDYAVNEYKECIANEFGYTDNGDPIYKTGVGDASYLTTTYLVRVEDSTSYVKEPYLIVFSVSNVLFGEEREEWWNYKDFREMKEVVENVVKTLHQKEGRG